VSYIPAALRRAGYTFQPPACSHTRGFTALPLDQQRALYAGVEHLMRHGAARPLCELLIEASQDRCDLTGLIGLLDQWRGRAMPEMDRVIGADRMPPRSLRAVS